MIEWFESKPHHFVVNGKGRSFGGRPFTKAEKDDALMHLQCWVRLAVKTCEAEFPSFGLFHAFTAFKLPKTKRACVDTFMTSDVLKKLTRLAATYKRRQLIQEFRSHWPYALQSYLSTSCQCTYWEAWYASLDMKHNRAADLEYVIVRGDCHIPVTSKVEQFFALVDSRLGSKRLNATTEMKV